MKKPFIALVGCAMIVGSLPALAGPDWQFIEHGRKLKQQEQARDAARMTTNGCPPPALVLPLDYGPRAVTTPAQTKLRQERYAAALRACEQGKG